MISSLCMFRGSSGTDLYGGGVGGQSHKVSVKGSGNKNCNNALVLPTYSFQLNKVSCS